LLTDTTRYPSFDLARLLTEVFAPSGGERVAVLIDLPDPRLMRDFGFLEHPEFDIQRNAYEFFFLPLKEQACKEMRLVEKGIFAYEMTGGSNLDLPDAACGPDGEFISLERDLYPAIDIVLCISTFSATAPLTAFAKQYGFRGATLHGVNKIILNSGLSVSYEDVSRNAEKLRRGLTGAERVMIDFETFGETYTLTLELGGQEAQKSHGLCREGPDICNLPAGEIYFVPTGATGRFPQRFEDGTIGLMHVEDGGIKSVSLLRGDEKVLNQYGAKITSDPAAGRLGELGFGTQELPVSGRDIQDEKILGTIHVATGRSDHLGGDIVPGSFHDKKNATHEDILFAPHKTPEILVRQARMVRGGETVVLIEKYTPSQYIRDLLSAQG